MKSQSTPSPSLSDPKPIEFDKIAASVESAEPVKKKRGRPPKAVSTEGTTSQSSDAHAPDAFGSPTPPTTPEPLPPEAVKPWVEAGYAGLQSYTGYPGWQPSINQGEIELLSKQAAFSLNKHFPTMANSPYFDLVVLGSTVVGIVVGKYRGQMQWMAEQKAALGDKAAS